MKENITFTTLGIIHSPFKVPEGTPIQPKSAKGARGKVVVYKEYKDGLKDLSGFSHIILLFYFHLSESGYSLKAKPYMDNNLHGIFATRAPRRPNPIGLSVVRLNRIKGNILYIEDVDIIDGTPLLDIKPYVPDFDIMEVTKTGWLKKQVHKLPSQKDDGRFAGRE